MNKVPLIHVLCRRLSTEKYVCSDILVIAERSEIERLQKRFTEELTWITMDVGKKHSYLGMQI